MMTDIEKFAPKNYTNSNLIFNSNDNSCYGYSDGYINGFGYGYGSGAGYGCINGSGHNNSSNYDYNKDTIKSVNGFPVYVIDDTQTGIISAKDNVAKGFILRGDLTIKFCYIVKNYNGIYAHGETLKEAQEALGEKQLERMPIEERLQLFKGLFNENELYEGQEFYNWHHILTGSCKMGRDNFCEEHGIDLKAKYTVKDFIELTENSYGGEIIKKLRRIYEQ